MVLLQQSWQRFFVATIAFFLTPDAGKAQSYASESVKASSSVSTTASTVGTQKRYTELDRIAKKLPDSQATTLRQLAASLSVFAKNDDEKARIIFAWLAHHIAYDFKSFNSNRSSNCQPTYVLQTRTSVCQGYANLFTALATRMNLSARTIIGYGKTGRLRNEDLAKDTNHAWNCYLSNGTWRLIDATWGAGSIISNAFKQEYDPFWFDTSPTSFVFSHLPESKDSLKQFLPSLVPKKIFFRWPSVDEEFFKLGISGTYLMNSFADNNSGEITLPKIAGPSCGSKIKQVPQWNKLAAKVPVKFIFTAPDNIEMAIRNGDTVTPFERKFGFLYKDVIPTKNDIIVLVWKKSVPDKRYHLLRYNTVQATISSPIRESNLLPDSITYFRPQ